MTSSNMGRILINAVVATWLLCVAALPATTLALTDPPQACEGGPAIGNGTSHAFRLDANGIDYVPDPSRGGLHFTEFANGTARLQGGIMRAGNNNKKFDVLIELSSRVNQGDPSFAPPGAPFKELPICDYVDGVLLGCVEPGPIDPNTWHYYTALSGILTGQGVYQGGAIELSFVPMMAYLQVGTGANGKTLAYGLSTWFDGEVLSQPSNLSYRLWPLGTEGYSHGDVNIDLECEDTDPPSCEAFFLSDNSCSDGTNTIVVQGIGSPNSLTFEYDWSADCGGRAVTIVENGNQASVTLNEPLIDEQVTCNLTLTMTDQFLRQTVCGTSAPVSACELGCDSFDVQANLAKLDGNTHLQNLNVKKLVKLLRQTSGNEKAGMKELKQAEDLFAESWSNIWTLPPVAVQCTNEILCVSVSNEPTLSLLEENSLSFRELSKSLNVRVLKRAKGDAVTAKKSVKLDSKAAALHQENLVLTDGYPSSQSVCPD